MPRLFATRPFMHAGDIVDVLLYDHDSWVFSYSELAAASFYFVADKGGITNAVFEQCTGYAIDEVWPAIEHLQGLLLNGVYVEEEPEVLGTMLCCSLQDRYSEHPKYIKHEQLWRLQSYHAHMWADFKDALSGEF
ncbi:hypothetical protein LPJ56_003003 [Coemansia sp. RSA 2599]|nr:hypothetical protein LPJ56_003003 [Coemansia sp. RSA 2599]